MAQENTVLCGANSYEQKYYFNPQFEKLPEDIKQEIQVMCVMYTEEVGGILTMEYEEGGTLIFKSMADDMDYYYDDISAGLKIKQMQQTKQTLLESLETYYKVFFLKEQISI